MTRVLVALGAVGMLALGFAAVLLFAWLEDWWFNRREARALARMHTCSNCGGLGPLDQHGWCGVCIASIEQLVRR